MPLFIANVGVPMLFVHMPAILVALLPIIVIETWIATKVLKLTWRLAWPAVTKANLLSMLLGFPLLWFVVLILQICLGQDRFHEIETIGQRIYAITVEAAWLAPYEGELYWMGPCAAIALLVPAFFMSVFVERWIVHFYWPDQPQASLRRYTWVAHIASYALLTSIWLVCLTHDVQAHRRHQNKESDIKKPQEQTSFTPTQFDSALQLSSCKLNELNA